MKLSVRSLFAAFAALSAAVSVTACGPYPFAGGNRYYQIPWPSDSGYRIQRVEVKTYNQPDQFIGAYATLLVEPGMGKNGLESQKSVGRYMEIDDGTLVPTDFISLQAATVYAHAERLHELDVLIGSEKTPEGKSLWPIKVGLRALLSDGESTTKDNAVYDGQNDALFLVPYTQKDLPITFNGGILAHEHFHKIFQYNILAHLKSSRPDVHGYLKAARDSGERSLDIHVCGIASEAEEKVEVKKGTRTKSYAAGSSGDDKLDRSLTALEYNDFLLRALNEGLADFWGWLYSGDVNFIAHSLTESGSRKLDRPRINLLSTDVIRLNLQRLRDGEKRTALAYTLGTQYANFMRKIVLSQHDGKDGPEQRAAVAKALIRALPQVRDVFKANLEKEFVSPDVILAPVLDALGEVKASSCELYESFIPAGRKDETPGAERPKACKKPEIPVPPEVPPEVPAEAPPVPQTPPAPPVDEVPAPETPPAVEGPSLTIEGGPK